MKERELRAQLLTLAADVQEHLDEAEKMMHEYEVVDLETKDIYDIGEHGFSKTRDSLVALALEMKSPKGKKAKPRNHLS